MYLFLPKRLSPTNLLTFPPSLIGSNVVLIPVFCLNIRAASAALSAVTIQPASSPILAISSRVSFFPTMVAKSDIVSINCAFASLDSPNNCLTTFGKSSPGFNTSFTTPNSLDKKLEAPFIRSSVDLSSLKPMLIKSSTCDSAIPFSSSLDFPANSGRLLIIRMNMPATFNFAFGSTLKLELLTISKLLFK